MLSHVRQFYDAVRPLMPELVLSEEEWESGMQQLQIGAAAVGLEAALALSLELNFAEAVTDGARFPKLRRVHLAVSDLLTLKLPPEMRAMVGRLLEGPGPEMERTVERIQNGLALAATGDASPVDRGLAEFFLFEALRVGLVLATWQERGALIEMGLDLDNLDWQAEKAAANLLHKCGEELAGADPIRPLPVGLAAAMLSLGECVAQAKQALATVTPELVARYQARARLQEMLDSMPTDDALLVRNKLAKDYGFEEHLSVERLVDEHPVAFPDGVPMKAARNKLDQRTKRKTDLLKGKGPTALARKETEPALVDLLLKARRM